MKLKKGFVLHPLGKEYVAVPLGEESSQFNGVIRMNETGALIWRLLEQETDRDTVVRKICEACSEVRPAEAAEDLEDFLAMIEPVLDHERDHL